MSSDRTILRARPRAAAVALLLAATALAGGCQRPAEFNGRPVPTWRPEGGDRAAALFGPRQVTLSPEQGAQHVEPPPMAWFNERAAWPASAGISLGEVTFYRELYYDRQSSYSSGRRPIFNHVQRRFQIYRSGVLIR